MPDSVGAPAFDAVIAIAAGADAQVGGLSLLQRAVFTVARAGCGRVLCVGALPRDPHPRLPAVAITWSDATLAPAMDWLAESRLPLVVVDTSTIVDAATVAALARAPGPATLTATGPGTLWRTDSSTLSDALRAGTAQDPNKPPAAGAPWQPPAGALVQPAVDAAGRAEAERLLYDRLGRPGDGWFTRVVDRRLSRLLTRVLLPTGISPNQVTIGSIAIGIGGGCCFALGTPRAAAIGALLFLLSTIVDGCDGEIARLTFRESAFGARLDILGDNLVHVFLFGGIAMGLYRRSGDPTIALLGTALVVGVLLAMASVYAFVVRRPPNSLQRALFEAFASREFAYLLVVLTLVGRLDWFLWLSAIGTYAFAGGLLILGLRRNAS